MNAMRAYLLLLTLFAVPLSAQHGEQQARTFPPLTPALIRADLVVVREQFIMRDAAFTADTRAAALERLARLDRAADTVQRAFLELEIGRIAALADNGHTSSPAVMRAPRFNRIGVRFTPLSDGVYVMRTQAEHRDLLGARLVAINARPIDSVRDAARELQGGIPAWRDRSAPNLFESPELLAALGLSAESGAATYTFILADGRRIDRALVGDPPQATRSYASTSRWLSPSPMEPDGREWVTLLNEVEAPWSVRDWKARFRWRDAPELDGVVVELRQNVDAPGQPIRAFLDSVTRVLTARKPRNIVLDLRLNGGGDLNNTRDFVQALPAIASGNIFVLTSPYTFSAAISTAGYAKQAAPERVRIVGEGVGDRLIFFAEGRPVELPNSGIGIGVARERHDYVTGCRPYPDCHGAVVKFPIAVPSLAPDLVAPWTMTAYRARKDPAIDAIIAALHREAPRTE